MLGVGLGVLRVAEETAVEADNSSRLADGPDLDDPLRFEGNLRGQAGPCGAHDRRGIPAGNEAVAMLMRRAGIQGLPDNRNRRRKAPSTPTASDLVDRNFARSDPDQLWVTDITEHRTREGKLYCCVVLDTFSRRVVGWSTNSTQTSTLVTNALGMAISNRQPAPDSGLIIHSDQGSSRPGRSPGEPASPGCCHRWDRSATVSTTPSSNPSGRDSKSRSSTGNAGGPGSSWQTPSSSTSRSSTTANAATQRSGCSPRSNMKHFEPANPQHDEFQQTARAKPKAHQSLRNTRGGSESRRVRDNGARNNRPRRQRSWLW